MVSRFVMILACLFAAIVCYAIGLHAGIVVFVLLGVLFEMIFWLGIAKPTPVDEESVLHNERP